MERFEEKDPQKSKKSPVEIKLQEINNTLNYLTDELSKLEDALKLVMNCSIPVTVIDNDQQSEQSSELSKRLSTFQQSIASQSDKVAGILSRLDI